MPDTRPIITFPEEVRQNIFTKVKQALVSKFPIETTNLIAEMSNVEVDHKVLPHSKQKKIRMSKGNASSGVYCDLAIKDKETGELLHTLKHHRIMNIPYYTDRYTFIVDGNEYNLVNQLRTKSGVYTRKRGNEELESSFNLSKGANFKILMDPDTGIFKMSILHATLPLLAVLKVLGANPAEVQKAMGKELYDKNASFSSVQYGRAIDTLYTKLIKYKNNLGDTASKDEKIKAIRAYFAGTELDPETTKLTLGESFTKVQVQTILQAMKKMLQVFNEEEDVDNRDGLEFQKVFTPEDILKEVLEKSTREVTKLREKLNSFSFTGDEKPGSAEATQKLKAIFSPSVFTRPVRSFLATSSISRLPDQINPMEIMDGASIVTRLGEGAISSEQAVPDETRAVQYSYMGLIDPVMAPESSKVGIDNRFAMRALKGNQDNELYKEVLDAKTSKVEQHRAIDLYSKKVGFPDSPGTEKKPGDKISAVYQGKLIEVPRSELDYQIPTPHHLNAAATNNIPFLNANQANRILMAAKHQSQALPLKDRESRLVEATMDSTGGQSVVDQAGGFLIPKSPVDGVVSKITDDYIYIKDASGVQHTVDYATHMPMASKTALHNTLSVAVGDSVKKGEALGDNTFTKDGKFAAGVNLNIAYMPYKGYNHEDGVVISESAAKKLTSIHSNTVQVTLDKTTITGKDNFKGAFPTEFSTKQLSKLDAQGVVKKGEVLENGDPVILLLSDAAENRVNLVLGKLHKSLITPYDNISEVYEGDYPAKVVEVQNAGKHITVLLEIEKPAGIGDKVGGTYGNKGVITRIEPDDQIVKDEDGNPLDIIVTSAGVIGRINPSQTLETALGKIAKKTGKPYKIENYSHDDYVGWVKEEMKKNGVRETDTLTDPETGKKIPGIFTGVQHIQKFHKTTDTNFSGRGVMGAYDQDDAPVGSGMSGPKALGGMEVNALLAHNARSFLKESTLVRGSKNSEFWNNFQYGGIPHFPNEKKTFNKFVATLKQAGINVEKKGDDFVAGPLTDKDILGMSSGEIQNALRVDAKTIQPEKGGLFDPIITGGLDGDRWSHVTLAEPVVNPVFEDCVAALLGMSKKDLQTAFETKGGDEIKRRLNQIDVARELEASEKKLNDTKVKGLALDKLVRKIKYLRTLKERGLRAGDAYVLTAMPVTPPAMRSISISKTGDLMPNDSNEFYKNLILNNQAFKDIKKEQGFEDTKRENRAALQQSVRELTGVVSTGSPQLRNRGAKGAIKFIAGDQPKYGYFQRKAIYSKMNLTGRATIAPDETLGLDEVGLPEEMAWEMYTPFILRTLTGRGFTAREAKEEVEGRTAKAKDILMRELETRPVIVNRAPTLWKHSMLAAKPKLRSGKTLLVNTLWESSTNADFDGDSALNSIFYRVKKDSENQHLGLTSTINGNSILGNNNSPRKKEDTMPFDSTTIRYSHGLVNLEDFPRIEETRKEEGNKIKFEVPEGVEVLSVMDGEKQWLPVEEYSIHTGLPMVELQTNSKRTLHVSLDDSLITTDKDLHYVKAKPAVGVVIPRVLDPMNMKNSEDELKHITVDGAVIAVDRDLGWLAGAFIGDGWLNEEGYCENTSNANAVMVCKTDKGFIDSWCRIVQDKFGDTKFGTRDAPHDFNGHASFSQKTTCFNATLMHYFRDFHTHTAARKDLPTFWPETSEAYRWGILAGLIDSDGSVSMIHAKAKKHPQLSINYTSISKPLIFNIVALANSLGLTATAYFAKMTEAGNESWGVTFTTASIIKMQAKLQLNNGEKVVVLSQFKPRAKTRSAIDGKQYTPILSGERLKELRKSIPSKQIYRRQSVNGKQVKTGELLVPESDIPMIKAMESIKVVIGRCLKREEPLTLDTAKKILSLNLDIFNTSDFWKKWKSMVEDDSIVWEKVISMKPIPVTTAYDITAPPNFTMVTEAGFVIQDTMQVHLPITDEAVNETKNMFPSAQIMSDKQRGSLLMAPSQEPIVGLYEVTKNLGKFNAGAVKRYKTEAEAWDAYYKGTLKMTDTVEISA